MSCFNPSNDAFKEATNSEIYIDKTGLLNCTNKVLCTAQKCIAVSHARRFGKSQAAETISAYYSKGCDSRELLSKFEIAKSPDFEKHLNKYNVIHLDVSSYTDLLRDRNVVDRITDSLYRELKAEYPNLPEKSNTIESILNYVYKESGSRFVIIIDEWDCVVRNYANKPVMVHEYMQFLHSLFKSEEAKKFLALGYITGILPIKKIKDESALNNFREYTMINSKNLTPYFGFTKDEVEKLCEKYEMDFETIKAWYNGYLINGEHMYNPNSVTQAVMDHCVESYWTNTSSYETLNNYIEMNFDGLKDDVLTIAGGGYVPVDTSKFRNDLSEIRSKDDALTALIHLGYLGYDAEKESAYMPNYEVSTALKMALEDSGWKNVAASLALSKQLLDATIAKDGKRVAEILNDAHSAFVPILKYNSEDSLRCVIRMAYYTAPQYYTVIDELPSGEGYVDIAFLPHKNCSKPPMIIELKWNKTADAAIQQIKEKRYTEVLKKFVNSCGNSEILLVGVSYSKRSKTKKHTCVIESFSPTEE